MKPTAQAQLPALSKPGAFESVRLAHQSRMRDAFIEFMGSDSNRSVLELKLPAECQQPAGESLHDVLAEKRPKIASYVLDPGAMRAWKESAPSHENQGGGHCLPYEDGSVDWVYCDGVIEQVGGRAAQEMLIRELWRVARKGVFVTAQNRRHPIDFGSGSLFFHWLGKARPGKAGASADDGANRLPAQRHLLDAPALEEMASRLAGSASHAVGHVRYCGVKAHFFLMISKK